MKITYEAAASHEIIGKDWNAYRRTKSGVTYIFDELWQVLKTDEIPFDELEDYLIESKKKAQSKAYCSISEYRGTIELNQYGVLPIIWIIKK